MKVSPFGSGILMVIGLLAGSLALTDESQEPVPPIDVKAAQSLVATHDDAVIVDVRTPIEYGMSHIPGAVNVDVQDESFWNAVSNLDRDKTYIVHCTKNPAGGRSSRALETMKSLGFKNLYSLEGGYIAWQEADLPLTESAK